jgi:cytochrome bd-type quinol oxidase subunit 2
MTGFLSTVPGWVALIGLITLVLVGSSRLRARGEGGSQSPARTIMQIVISVFVLFAGLYIILSNGYDEGVQKWAFGAIGTLLGYWLPIVT